MRLYDDTDKLGPRVVSTVREGMPRGGLENSFPLSKHDGRPKSDGTVHRQRETATGYYQPGRTLD